MLFQEDSPVKEQKPDISTIQIHTSNSGNNVNDSDDDSITSPKRIRIDGTVSLAKRSSVDSTNGHLQGHKNGELDETESGGDVQIESIDETETIDAEGSPGFESGLRSLISLLEKEVNSLDCLLVTKELEWNTILRFKKLKEILLEQLRREEDIGALLGQADGIDVKTLVNECTLEHKNIIRIDSQAKSLTNRIRNETSKVELEITENSGRRYRKIVTKEDPLHLDQRNASKALQKLCEKNSNSPGADKKPGPKGPTVQVTSLIADYRAKRKHDAMTGRKQKSNKGGQNTTQISYSDVLVSLAKISSSESKSALPDVSSNIATPTTTKPVSRGVVHGITSSKSNITLAKLLSASGTPNATSHRGEETKSTSDDYKGRHVNSSTASENNISLSNLLASNSKISAQTRNEPTQKSDSIPICQGCNANQAQFVCAGCGNQWYCSRDCQVEAWDDHAESCSG